MRFSRIERTAAPIREGYKTPVHIQPVWNEQETVLLFRLFLKFCNFNR